jgi:2-methylisocitrate lyase-like PEP mutase family enzyme
MASQGAQALATTSAGFAFTIGLPDGGYIECDEMLSHCSDIVNATPLPVSADLENGYGDTLDELAETIELAIETGLAGCSIEDSTLELGAEGSDLSFDFDEAVERVRTAAEVIEDCPYPFTLTARADGIMLGSYGLDEAITRIKAFELAGANVIYVPMVGSLEDLYKICTSVDVPVNVLASGDFLKYNTKDFAKAGAARISIGSSMARKTHKLIMDATSQMLDEGNFSIMQNAASGDEVDYCLYEYMDE